MKHETCLRCGWERDEHEYGLGCGCDAWSKATWVRVTSADELRAGMTVKAIECRECGRAHVATLIRQVHIGCHVHDCQHFGMVWVQISCTGEGVTCKGLALSEGRLFRLADTDTTETETTAPARKPRRVRRDA